MVGTKICRGSGQRRAGTSHSLTSQKKRCSSFLGCCGAYLASSVKRRQGWPRLRRPGPASCATLFSNVQRAGNERGSEEQGESGRQESGGETERINLLMERQYFHPA